MKTLKAGACLPAVKLLLSSSFSTNANDKSKDDTREEMTAQL
jgi:hypothetical protein